MVDVATLRRKLSALCGASAPFKSSRAIGTLRRKRAVQELKGCRHIAAQARRSRAMLFLKTSNQHSMKLSLIKRKQRILFFIVL